MTIKNKNLSKLIISAVSITLCMILPFVTGNIPTIGNMLCPMHLPVLLCGFICGPWFGLAVGAISPILRSFTLGAPPIFPMAFSMAFELAAYGFVSGLMNKLMPKKIPFIYVSLITAMLAGRAVWGTVRMLIYGLGGTEFGAAAFLAGAFTTAIPGIIIQIILVPVIIIALRKEKLTLD